MSDDQIFKDVNPCSKCGSSKKNFWYRRIPAHFTADSRVMAMYECANRDHKHSILEPDLRAYGKNLKIAMSRAKKLWNKNNPKNKLQKERDMTNFEKITKSPEALAEESVYLVYDKYSDGTEWMSVFINGTWRSWEEAVAATLEWLKKEVEE